MLGRSGRFIEELATKYKSQPVCVCVCHQPSFVPLFTGVSPLPPCKLCLLTEFYSDPSKAPRHTEKLIIDRHVPDMFSGCKRDLHLGTVKYDLLPILHQCPYLSFQQYYFIASVFCVRLCCIKPSSTTV